MKKRLAITIMALAILSGSAFSEDVIFPKHHGQPKSIFDYLKATWSYVVRIVQ